MPKATQLPSGNYRVRIVIGRTHDGKPVTKSFTALTAYEAEQMAEEYERHYINVPTVRQTIEHYIGLCSILSPTTVGNYAKISNYAFRDILDVKIDALTHEIVQNAINTEAKRKGVKTGRTISPKTVRNEWSLISSALLEYGVRFDRIKLPKNQKRKKYYPSPEELMPIILESSIMIPCLLALCLSFTASEIRGLKCSDIRGQYIAVNRVQVYINGLNIVKEQAKTETRLRRLKMPEFLRSMLVASEPYQHYKRTNRDGFLVPLTHGQILGRWHRIAERYNLGLTFHDLRHVNASVMEMLDIPEAYAMERGGWSSSETMKNVYTHTFTHAREAADDRVNAYFSNLFVTSNNAEPTFTPYYNNVATAKPQSRWNYNEYNGFDSRVLLQDDRDARAEDVEKSSLDGLEPPQIDGDD